MGSYRNENLKQCVRNLFAQAQYEFRVIHNIEYKFKTDLSDILKCKFFSLWKNESDCFYATALELIRIHNDSKIMVDLSVYVNFSDYTCSYPMGLCQTPEEVFEWLRNPEQLQKCLDKIDELIDTIDLCFVE